MVQGMSAQVQGSTGLMRIKEVDDIQAQVLLEPLNVRVGAVKDLKTGERAHTYSAETSLETYQLIEKEPKAVGVGRRQWDIFPFGLFSRISLRFKPTQHTFHRYPTACVTVAPKHTHVT